MTTIENESLRITINPVGAELTSLFNKATGREYLWQADAAYWPKHSPVLFPIIGTLKDNHYYFEEKEYQLSRHGFAREKTFTVTMKSATTVAFELTDDAATRAVYPFQFTLSLQYTLEENRLSVAYHVTNNGNAAMYFSVGGHPAFKMPIEEGLAYEDYYLLFNNIETTGRWPINAVGLLEKNPVPLLNNTQLLPLTKELFYKDAIVIKHPASNEVQLKSDRHPAGLSFSFEGFPFLGIWAAKDADFLCIEPWCGVADSVNSQPLLAQKEGIETLAPGDEFVRTWRVATF